MKEELSKLTVLGLYDPQADPKISADSSSYGLGAVLMQRSSPQSDWKHIVYASRALSDTESHYTQVEEDALACTWATEKFTVYIFGKNFTWRQITNL